MNKTSDGPVSFEVDDEQGYLVIRFAGEIDLYGSPHAREVILNCLEQKRNTVIDLSAVNYIDSSGVASLVEGYQLAKNKQLEFGLVNVSEAAMNVLQLAHLDKVFPIHASLSERLQTS
jgi:anti-sigma B factor antagonist